MAQGHCEHLRTVLVTNQLTTCLCERARNSNMYNMQRLNKIQVKQAELALKKILTVKKYLPLFLKVSLKEILKALLLS